MRPMAEQLRIDTHVHLYETTELAEGAKSDYDVWEYGEKPDIRFSAHAGTVDDAIVAMAESGFAKAVVVNLWSEGLDRRRLASEVEAGMLDAAVEAATPARLLEYNQWACDVAREHPQFIPYVSIDPHAETSGTLEMLTDLVEHHGARGLKLHAARLGFSMDDRRMWPLYQRCVELGIPIVAHSGPARDGEQYAGPRAVAEVLRAFPELVLVVAHMGGGSWRQLPELIGLSSNVAYDCSEIIAWLGAPRAPTARQCVDLVQQIGSDRAMLGSDFPWYDIGHSAAIVLDLPGLSDEEKEAILGANAERILSL